MTTPSDLHVRQNKHINLERLAASNILYSKAKQANNISILLALATVGFGIADEQFGEKANYATLVMIVVALIDSFWVGWARKENIAKAVKIQEEFDCDVMQLSPNATLCPNPVTAVEVSDLALSTMGNPQKVNRLKNWYPVTLGQLPRAAAALYAQKDNAFWSLQNQKQHHSTLLILMGLSIISPLLWAWFANTPFQVAMTQIIAPFVPAVLASSRLVWENAIALRRARDLHDGLNKTWRNLLATPTYDDAAVMNGVRVFQDDMYNFRLLSTPVPDVLHNLLKPRNQASIDADTQRAVNDFLAAHP